MTAQEGPDTPKERSKTLTIAPQEASKTTPRGLQEAKKLQEDSGEPFGTHLPPF